MFSIDVGGGFDFEENKTYYLNSLNFFYVRWEFSNIFQRHWDATSEENFENLYNKENLKLQHDLFADS